MIVFGDGTSGRVRVKYDHEIGAFMMGLVLLEEQTPEGLLVLYHVSTQQGQ